MEMNGYSLFVSVFIFAVKFFVKGLLILLKQIMNCEKYILFFCLTVKGQVFSFGFLH